MKNSLGIIGGLGPMASSYLYEMITKKTKALKDQDHLNIILLSHSSIPDRTAYILKESDESPYPYLLEDCRTLERMGAKMIVIPCNTSHYFYEKLQDEINIPISNMIKNTAVYIKKLGYKKVAILATTGTIKSNLYQSELEKYNIEYVLPEQSIIMEIIYDYIKAGKKVPESLWKKAIDSLEVDGYILGCTELSLLKKELRLDEKYIDPLEVETDVILDFFGKERKG